MQSRTVSILLLAVTFALCLGLVFFVLWGGWNLGLFLMTLLVEAVFCAWLWLPQARPLTPGADTPAGETGIRASMPLLVFLAVAVVDLGFCFYLYDNPVVKLLDLPILLGLCIIQYLLAARAFRQDWDQPGFWVEAVLSVFIRPFDGLGGFGRSVAGLFTRKHAQPHAAPSRFTVGKVLLGILLAVPVLLVAGALLSSADVVFARIFDRIRDWLSALFSKDLPVQLLVALGILPFFYSFLYSGRNNTPLVNSPAAKGVNASAGFRLDKAVLITFLTCVNLLYLVFAFVQLAYLTGAFRAVLPEDMTYAEYARSGFFELAGVSVVNLALGVLAVKAADREGTAGRVVRAESLLLVVCSLVQWVSAMFRMGMYIDAYGLSQLRFFVTAFMLLLLALFGMVVIKEFRPSFPLFKSCAIAAVVSLLLLNHANSDAWIARTNIRHYEATGAVDLDYLRELSDDAVPALLDLYDTGDPGVSPALAAQLRDRYDGLAERRDDASVFESNIAQGRAFRRLGDRIGELRSAADDTP